MDSNSEEFPLSPFSDEEEAEMTTVLNSDLETQVRKLLHQRRQMSERLSELMSLNGSLSSRVTQLNLEIESLRGQFQDLNLLDGFLRSGAVKAINLENEPTLKVLLTSFLARALQTALDTGAVQFPNRKKNGE